MTAAEAALSLRRKLVAAHHAKGSALTEREWLDLAEAELGGILTLKAAKTRKASSFSMGAGQSDDDWLAEIGSHPALVGVNVRQEVENCRLWCVARPAKCSRRRIVNWLLKAVADRPLRPQQSQYAGRIANQDTTGQLEPEPMGWREEFPEFLGVKDGVPWHKIDLTARAHICRQMTELAQKQA